MNGGATGGAAPVGSIRLATPEDAQAIDELMKASIRDIFPQFYDERQTASSIVHVASVDRTLIEDGTYFVIEETRELIACGGWSRRDKLYTGSGAGTTDARLLDPRTEPARVRAMFVRPRSDTPRARDANPGGLRGRRTDGRVPDPRADGDAPRLAIAAAAVVVVAVVGMNLLPARGGGGGGPAVSPSPSPSASPTLLTSPSPTPAAVFPRRASSRSAGIR